VFRSWPFQKLQGEVLLADSCGRVLVGVVLYAIYAANNMYLFVPGLLWWVMYKNWDIS